MFTFCYCLSLKVDTYIQTEQHLWSVLSLYIRSSNICCPFECCLLQADVFKAFSELFQAASCRPAPYGICAYPSSRAIYAIDLMLKWDQTVEGISCRRSKHTPQYSRYIVSDWNFCFGVKFNKKSHDSLCTWNQ